MQGLFVVHFLGEAQEPVVRSRSSVGDILEEAAVGSGEPYTMLPLEEPDRVLCQGRPKSISMV
ncbi:hypothetical protein AQI96_34775 [Streptomyces canus]|nr:hypothetical protein AQI96_34775 [Streptomyces canus]